MIQFPIVRTREKEINRGSVTCHKGGGIRMVTCHKGGGIRMVTRSQGRKHPHGHMSQYDSIITLGVKSHVSTHI